MLPVSTLRSAKTGLLTESGKKAIGVHVVEKVAGVEILAVFERSGQKMDLIKGGNGWAWSATGEAADQEAVARQATGSQDAQA